MGLPNLHVFKQSELLFFAKCVPRKSQQRLLQDASLFPHKSVSAKTFLQRRKKWRDQIKALDLVDFGMPSQSGQFVWYQAMVVSGDATHVTIFCEEFTLKVARYENNLAKPNTRIKDRSLDFEVTRDKPESKDEQKWRAELKVGDEVDAIDQQQQWYIATIKQEKLDEHGNKTFFIKYSEWVEKWNVWIRQSSPNLRPPYSCSKTRGVQDFINSNHMTQLNDYQNVSTDLTDSSINRCVQPPLIDTGIFFMVIFFPQMSGGA